MGVTSYEETLDVSCMTVTPACSKGALDTWRSQGGPRTQCRDQAAGNEGTRLWANQRGRACGRRPARWATHRVVHGKLAGARSASSTNPQPDAAAEVNRSKAAFLTSRGR